MIVRIVKMTFVPEMVNQFVEIFDSSKQLIRNMDGCSHLELLNDVNAPNIFFTYSYWQSETDLANYRNSELFQHVWKKTKVLFVCKAEAWSLEQHRVL